MKKVPPVKFIGRGSPLTPVEIWVAVYQLEKSLSKDSLNFSRGQLLSIRKRLNNVNKRLSELFVEHFLEK